MSGSDRMGHQLFEVPVIQQDLRHEETIVQIADSLEYLSSVFNDVFLRIEQRIEVNKSKLAALHGRVDITRAKVQKLTGSNKATKVFSSAKYPATAVHVDYVSGFIASAPLKMKHHSEKIISNHLPLDTKVLQEKLQFYHVKVSNKLFRRNVEIAPEEGLGSLPQDVDCVGSLLLFNTSENPYKRYVMLDPLGAVGKMRPLADDDEGKQMEAAPLSISHREKIERQQQDSYFYSPGLGEVPLIDVPLDLPYLPGVADDLFYSVGAEPMIAPSVTTTPVIPDLPTLASERTTPPPPTPLIATTPLPPPPPPPPPPPSLVLAALHPPPTIDTPKADARTNLMAAIRQAGGIKKASVKERPAEGKKKAKKEVEKDAMEGSGNDLMADLHAKLAMRRKGISGVIKNTESSAMDRIKDMIPPPAARETPASNTEEDEDWE